MIRRRRLFWWYSGRTLKYEWCHDWLALSLLQRENSTDG